MAGYIRIRTRGDHVLAPGGKITLAIRGLSYYFPKSASPNAGAAVIGMIGVDEPFVATATHQAFHAAVISDADFYVDLA